MEKGHLIHSQCEAWRCFNFKQHSAQMDLGLTESVLSSMHSKWYRKHSAVRKWKSWCQQCWTRNENTVAKKENIGLLFAYLQRLSLCSLKRTDLNNEGNMRRHSLFGTLNIIYSVFSFHSSCERNIVFSSLWITINENTIANHNVHLSLFTSSGSPLSLSDF